MDLKSEIDILKGNLKDLNKQYYDALKRIGELIEENEKLKSASVPHWRRGKTVPDDLGLYPLPESEKSPLSTQTKGYPSEAWVKAQMRGH
tara:strand:+ start:219 stop:488 length:270 start_codon:yes stop_codon:yes gene_type:complete